MSSREYITQRHPCALSSLNHDRLPTMSNRVRRPHRALIQSAALATVSERASDPSAISDAVFALRISSLLGPYTSNTSMVWSKMRANRAAVLAHTDRSSAVGGMIRGRRQSLSAARRKTVHDMQQRHVRDEKKVVSRSSLSPAFSTGKRRNGPCISLYFTGCILATHGRKRGSPRRGRVTDSRHSYTSSSKRRRQIGRAHV